MISNSRGLHRLKNIIIPTSIHKKFFVAKKKKTGKPQKCFPSFIQCNIDEI
jgi:hypothetical protein